MQHRSLIPHGELRYIKGMRMDPILLPWGIKWGIVFIAVCQQVSTCAKQYRLHVC
jgi:hypothetical protein